MKPIFIQLLAVILSACQRQTPATLRYRIVTTLPHDAGCYTQGLEYSGRRLFESSGLYDCSSVREVNRETDAVIQNHCLAGNFFAEGITLLNHELWVLTWKEHTALVLDPETLRFIRAYTYQGEGWGLTNDGVNLIMSDGSSTLKFIEPGDFSVKKTLKVKDGEQPVEQLNELEFVNGAIFANIYNTEKIARISADDGGVTGWLDLSGIRQHLPLPNHAEVLNGIAFDHATGRFLVTGKRWPLMFEIEVEEK